MAGDGRYRARDPSGCSMPTSPTSGVVRRDHRSRARAAHRRRGLKGLSRPWVVQIVNDELITILERRPARIQFAKTGADGDHMQPACRNPARPLRRQARQVARRPEPHPTCWKPAARPEGRDPALKVVAEQAGVAVYAPEPGNVGPRMPRRSRSSGATPTR
jgi:hypothetical protein